jgi:putative ABC transport system permease protein
MRLAWKNILHDRVRFLATVVGIAFAVFLMVFQGSLLFGFSRAASKLVDTTDSDLWITARGALCFDFAAPLSRRLMEIAESAPGVDHVSRMVISYAEYRSGDGKHHAIALIGADPEVGGRFPVPYVAGASTALEPEAVLIDQSNAKDLQVTAIPVDVEINKHRARVLRKVSGFGSFVGSPYVFTSYSNAVKYLGIRPEDSMYILLRLKAGYSAMDVKQSLQKRVPEVDVWTHDEFSRQSRTYWLTQTGAGGGILVAAILGFLVGLVVVSQTMYATTMEHLEEFATMKALGASKWFVVRIVLAQAVICGVVGCLLGLLATIPVIDGARQVITWIRTPWWLPAGVWLPTLLMCVVAANLSIRAALKVEPARVFRA